MSGPEATRGWLGLQRRALALGQPLSAHLELTYRCNWRCVFCFNPRHFDLRGLTREEWSAVLDDLRDLGTLSVTLTGGEPLTHPQFLRIAGDVRARGFTLRIFTNGSLVTEALAEGIASLRPVAVEMSLHGAGAETHDRATGRPGSFAALHEGMERLRRRGVALFLKTPLTRLNEGELEAMVAYVEGLGIPYQVDPTITPRDDGDRGPLAYRASAEATEKAYRLAAAQGRLPTSKREAGGVNCGLGRLVVAVDPEGNVFPCAQWRTRSMGNVRVTPLRELWRTSPEREKAAEVAQAANETLRVADEALARFPFCPALALEATGDALTPDETHRMQAAVAHHVRSTA